MANREQLVVLKAGVRAWNIWRGMNPEAKVDFSGADLRGADLREADLRGVSLRGANLTRADLQGANLYRADLGQANLTMAHLMGADLRGACLLQASSSADFSKADLRGANLSRADLNGAVLRGADLREAFLVTTSLFGADLSEADLRGANLIGSTFMGGNITNARISGCNVYGVNVWDVEGEFREQKDLIVTREHEPPITVDNLRVAQFVYLLLNHREVGDLIQTLTSRSVLILGCFAVAGRQAVSGSLREGLREVGLSPIVLDLDRPAGEDLVEAIQTLARLSLFVIADLTNPTAAPLEVEAAIPGSPVPLVPIVQEGDSASARLAGLQREYPWVLETVSYDSPATLLAALKPRMIDPAIEKFDELRRVRAQAPTVIAGRRAIRDGR